MRTQHPLQSLWSPCTNTFMGDYTLDWPPGLGLGTVISPVGTGKRICFQRHTHTKVTAGCNAKSCQHAPQPRMNTPVPETHQTDGAVMTTYTTFTCRITVTYKHQYQHTLACTHAYKHRHSYAPTYRRRYEHAHTYTPHIHTGLFITETTPGPTTLAEAMGKMGR